MGAYIDLISANWPMALVVALAIILAIVVFRTKGKTVAGQNKMVIGAVVLLIGGIVAYSAGFIPGTAPNTLSVVGDGSGSGSNDGTGVGGGNYQPTASYSTKDMFSTTTISGTSYYKQGTLPATTTIISNVNPNVKLSYWLDNDTYWVTPQTIVTTSGTNPIQALAFLNGTATVTGYDLVNRQSVQNGLYNTSMGANKQANIEISYQGTSKKSAAPFGGVMVVEYNSTIPDVSCTGADLLSSNPYQLTYTVASISNTFKQYAFGPTLDDGDGSVQKVTCQFNNGATAAGNQAIYYVKFVPANYYVSQQGDILLDTEKAADSSTTRTGTRNQPAMTAYWGT